MPNPFGAIAQQVPRLDTGTGPDAAATVLKELHRAQASQWQMKHFPSCNVDEDVDYSGEEFKTLFHMTPDACCKACLRQNRKRTGTCSVAVMSSEDDSPPKACWLKRNITGVARKNGVQAFWPPEQQKFVVT
mmetsp:Transcript_49750/g.116290  ORF Transcript_49750/g.116290 Transcript_49750/m.116290 type:complete len:132 (+) Transcript_49750:3-398(+)